MVSRKSCRLWVTRSVELEVRNCATATFAWIGAWFICTGCSRSLSYVDKKINMNFQWMTSTAHCAHTCAHTDRFFGNWLKELVVSCHVILRADDLNAMALKIGVICRHRPMSEQVALMRLCYYPIKGLQMVQGNLLFRREEGNLLYHNFTLETVFRLCLSTNYSLKLRKPCWA